MARKGLLAYASVFVLAIVVAPVVGNLWTAPAKAAGAAPVTIVNTPLPITGTVTFVPAQPFAVHGSGSTLDTLFAIDEFSVPANKRLIVETVTLSASVPAGDVASCGMTVEPAVGGQPVTHRFAVFPQGAAPGPFDVFVSTASVRLYFQPGDELNWFCYRNGVGFVSFSWSISGSLVDA